MKKLRFQTDAWDKRYLLVFVGGAITEPFSCWGHKIKSSQLYGSITTRSTWSDYMIDGSKRQKGTK